MLLNDNLKITANALNFIFEKKNVSSELNDTDAEVEEKKEVWKKSYCSSFEFAISLVEKEDKECYLQFNETLELLNELDNLHSEDYNGIEYAIDINVEYSIINSRFGYILDYGNGKLKYIPTSKMLFKELVYHEMQLILEDENSSIDDINTKLKNLISLVKNATFRRIDIKDIDKEDEIIEEEIIEEEIIDEIVEEGEIINE